MRLRRDRIVKLCCTSHVDWTSHFPPKEDAHELEFAYRGTEEETPEEEEVEEPEEEEPEEEAPRNIKQLVARIKKLEERLSAVEKKKCWW